jgi:hypothetical protein
MGHVGEILFLQHAAHTPFANMFDLPSGMFEPTDVTMAHGLVKVVKQATDLEVTEVTIGSLLMWEYLAYHVIGGVITRKLFCQINFVVKVGDERVRLNPETHSSARLVTGRDFKDLPLAEGTKNAVGMVLASAMRWEIEGSMPNFSGRTLGRNN